MTEEQPVPQFEKGEEVLDPIYERRGVVKEIVIKSEAFKHRVLYQVEFESGILFWKFKVTEWKLEEYIAKIV